MTRHRMERSLVKIEWADPAHDWPWFYLIRVRGEFLLLQGADYPDGSAKHDGDTFWVHRSEAKTIAVK